MKFVLSCLSVIGLAQAANEYFSSGQVSTKERFTYGKFITRMKTPDKAGTVASFFTYWDGPGFYPGGWNEIDINVVPSKEKNPVSTNVIFGDGHIKREDHDYTKDSNPGTEWHTYEIQWTPEEINFLVDGDEVRHMASGDHQAVDFLTKEQTLRMNFWTPTFHAWGADRESDDMPWELLFDYVEVYSYNQDSKDFDLDWRDDFNEFNSERWQKGTGTFEANSSIFAPNNVFVKDGSLVIKMEQDDHHQFDHHEEHHDNLHHHEHYHKGFEHEFLDEDFGHLVRDAVLPDNKRRQRSQLGKLKPRTDMKGKKDTQQQQTGKARGSQSQYKKPQQDQGPIGESRGLTAKKIDTEKHDAFYIEQHKDHTMHHELDHHYDQQHDIEPVHYHEHAILTALKVDGKDSKDIIDLYQKSEPHHISGHSDDLGRHRTIIHEHDHEVDKHHLRHDVPIIRTPRIEAVLDETPFEHHEARVHDSDAHFYTTHHDGQLDPRLRGHYEHEQTLHGDRDHRYSEWGEELQEIPRQYEHSTMGYQQQQYGGDQFYQLQPVMSHEEALAYRQEAQPLHEVMTPRYGGRHQETRMDHREVARHSIEHMLPQHEMARYEMPRHEMMAPQHEIAQHEMARYEMAPQHEVARHEIAHHEMAPQHEMTAHYEAARHEMAHEVARHEMPQQHEMMTQHYDRHYETPQITVAVDVHPDAYQHQATAIRDILTQHHDAPEVQQHTEVATSWVQAPHHETQQVSHEAPRHEIARHEAPRHEVARHEAPIHEAPRHEAPRHEAPRHEVARHEAPIHEAPRHEAPRHEAPRHEAPRHEAPRHEVARHETPIHEAPRHEVARHEAPIHETPRHEAPRHEAPILQAPIHEAPRHHHTQPVVTHDAHSDFHHDLKQVHHEATAVIDHDTHHALSHQYDDQRDVEPVLYHEHSVHQAFEHPESHSYHPEEPVLAYRQEEPVLAYHQEEPVHAYRQEEPVLAYHPEEPVLTYHQEEPVLAYRQEEPVHAYRQEEPVLAYRQEEPIRAYRQEEPVHTYRQEEPVLSYHQEEPIRAYHQEVPVHLEEPVQELPIYAVAEQPHHQEVYDQAEYTHIDAPFATKHYGGHHQATQAHREFTQTRRGGSHLKRPTLQGDVLIEPLFAMGAPHEEVSMHQQATPMYEVRDEYGRQRRMGSYQGQQPVHEMQMEYEVDQAGHVHLMDDTQPHHFLQ